MILPTSMVTVRKPKLKNVQSARRKSFKIILSVWAVFHVFCIFALPNATGFLGRYFQQVLTPYGNALSFNTPWNLFSPDPANTMYFSYVIHFEDTHDPAKIEAFFPPEKDQMVTDSSQRRLLYAMRFLLLDPARIDQLLGPWLCRQHPDALAISIREVVERIPQFDTVLTQPERSIEDMKTIEETAALSFQCRPDPSEVNL